MSINPVKDTDDPDMYSYELRAYNIEKKKFDKDMQNVYIIICGQ